MLIKCIYNFKLLLISLLSILMLSSVETAPEHPIRFLFISLAIFAVNKYLWRSTRKDEIIRHSHKTTAFFKILTEVKPIKKMRHSWLKN